jgi:hypothetical protein
MNYVKLGGGGVFKLNSDNEIVQDPINGIIAFNRNTNSADYQHEIYEAPDEMNQILTELATDNGTLQAQTVDILFRRYKDGATGNTFGDSISNTFQIQSNGTVVFEINTDGKIYTNQLKAPVARVTQAHEIPVYDTAGVLHGYIKVFT